jgi:hypothetical protein
MAFQGLRATKWLLSGCDRHFWNSRVNSSATHCYHEVAPTEQFLLDPRPYSLWKDQQTFHCECPYMRQVIAAFYW